jgi:hypothetical protein
MPAGTGSTFAPGDRVIYDGTGGRECGVVVHAWKSVELGGLEDCYVAFFGANFPEPDCAPTQTPYILRYGARSLRRAPAPIGESESTPDTKGARGDRPGR